MKPRQPVSLDVANATLLRGNTRIALRPKEIEVLHRLIEHRGRLVTKTDLIEAVWPGVTVSDAVLKVCINRLRAALGDDPQTPRFIETVHRRGYRLVGDVAMVSNTTSLLPVESESRESGIIAREAEIEQLEQCFARAATGERQVVLVTGEAGLGKTALVDAFLRTRAAGVRTTRGHCVEFYGSGEAYMPVFAALNALCEGRHGRTVIAHLNRHAPTWLAQMPGVVSIRELDDLARRTVGATRDRMLRELDDALGALTRTTTVVLVLEDLHWSDVSTLELVAMLARSRAAGRLLVLGTCRPEEMPALLRDLTPRGHAVEVAVAPFSATDVERWFHARFPGASLPPGLAAAAHRRTEGSPLFLSALADHWVAHGMFVEQSGRWSVKTDLEPLERAVPADVRRMIDARFAKLDERQRRLVEAASVAGQEFSAASVAAALDEPVAEVDAACTALARRGLFLRARGEEVWPDETVAGRYEFLHVLYRDVIREQVPPSRRVDFHRRVAIREEAGHGPAAGRIAARLAMHFEEARDYRAAARHALQAARNSVGRGGYHEAIAHATAGLTALDRLPQDREITEQVIDLHFEIRNALLPLGEQQKIFQHMRQAETLAEALHDDSRLGRACAYLTEYFRQAGSLRRSIEHGERAVMLGGAAGDTPLQLLASYFLGTVCHDAGDYRRAVECLRRTAAAMVGEREYERYGLPGLLSVLSRGRLSVSAAELGTFTEGAAEGQKALRIAESVDHPFTLTVACFGLGDLALAQGDLPTAIPLLERGLEICRAANVRTWLPSVATDLGHAYTLAGRVAEAIPLLERSVEQAAAMGISAFQARRLEFLSAAYQNDGRTNEATDLAGRAVRLARDVGARGYEAHALCQVGNVHAADPVTAEQAYREALALAEELGMRPLEARVRLGLGVLLRQRDQVDEAAALFRAMDMTLWLARARTERRRPQ